VGTFRAVRIDKAEGGQQTAKLVDFDENDLMDGDVTVRVEWSTVNYKDGLAVSGKAPVVRRFPMIPGIDFVGMVEHSTHPDWKPGDRVILNGWGVGETHLGAYAEKAHPTQNKRRDRGRQIHAGGEPASRDSAAISGHRQQIGERGRADAVDGARPAFLRQRLGRP